MTFKPPLFLKVYIQCYLTGSGLSRCYIEERSRATGHSETMYDDRFPYQWEKCDITRLGDAMFEKWVEAVKLG